MSMIMIAILRATMRFAVRSLHVHAISFSDNQCFFVIRFFFELFLAFLELVLGSADLIRVMALLDKYNKWGNVDWHSHPIL